MRTHVGRLVCWLASFFLRLSNENEDKNVIKTFDGIETDIRAQKNEAQAARAMRMLRGDVTLPEWKRKAELKRLRKAYASARKLGR